jgi:Cu2+-exporting ATPase
MSVLGIDRYETSPRTARAKIEYDPRQLGPAQIVEILDGALANAEHPYELDKPELELALCTASIPLAAIAQFAMPALLPSPQHYSPIRRSRASGVPLTC